MSGRKTQSDATAFQFMDTGGKSTSQYVEETVKNAMAEVNKATAFLNNPQTRTQVNVNGGVAGSHGGNVSYSTPPSGGATNQFNIVGGTIGQAAIGNEGDVVFNKENKVFNKGAVNNQYKITGGNFNQANIGGTSVYNNKGSSIGAGGRMEGGTAVSVEHLTLNIFEKGVTAEQLVALLEKNYSLANIAFAIPKDPELKERMIHALLA